MSKSIPAGYQVQITSWENDADHYKTKIKSGLTKDTAKFYLEFVEFFHSRHNWKGPKGYGNACDDSEIDWEDLVERFKALTEKYPNAIKEIGWDPEELDFDDEDGMHDAITELACDLMGGSEFYLFRVFEEAEVYFFEAPVNQVSIDLYKE